MAATTRPASILPPGMPPSAAPSRGARRRGQLALGVRLAARGTLVWLSLGLAGLTVLAAVAITLSVAKEGATSPLAAVTSLTSGALAWGAGVLVAFAAGAQALRRDVTEGIRSLMLARGATAASYALARAGGLAILLVAVLGGGTLVVGLVATLAASRLGLAAATLQATLASVVYAAAFAIAIAPIALAALGARSRAGGYGWLLLVLVLPELFARWTARALPDAWRELTSVPSVLAALRASLMPPGVDLARFARASLALALIVAFAILFLRREVARVASGPQATP